MPSNRPNLTLDEQSFQGLLSAAFTIQEHNDRLKQARLTQAEPEARREPEANSVCPHCGSLKPADGSRCESCGLDELRPGERLQRNWASMWLMSQKQVLWPERSPEIREGMRKGVPALDAERRPRAQAGRDFAASGILALPVAKEVAQESIAQKETATIPHRALGKAAAEGQWITAATDDFPREDLTPEDLTQEDLATEDLATEALRPKDLDLAVPPFQLSATDDSSPIDASADATTDAGIDPSNAATSSLIQRIADLRVKLRFHRADLYLGVAVFVAALGLLWPAAGSPRPGALGPWERTLVTLGIAEAPAPAVHLQGDPAIAVWVDPHTALYYCPGEEQYGKTAGGRFSSQREAQMDRFEPAGRSACE
ncbi:MAG: hypothetical protein ABR920_02095 [Terriglobales bacterium]